MKGKNALITGASKGIGKAIALKLAGKGCNLVITARNEVELKELSDTCYGMGVECSFLSADLSDPSAPGELIKKVLAKLGKLDILINNAGMAFNARVENTSQEQWDEIMNVNARAPFLLCRESIPFLKQSSSATIINISSVVGHKGYENQGAYTASKHALTGFTKVLAKELHPDGIRVHLISPGGVSTKMVSTMRPDLDTDSLIKPEDIADLVYFLLNNRNNAIIDEIKIRRNSSIPWS